MTERTEGWPVGLYLAALIARDSTGDEVTISGDDRYVADYLYRESLMRLPESTQRFLRRTAVLDQLCAPLCDALLGESGAQEQLRSLEASNLFLIPLDRRREWYRYHALFREFLLGELRRVEPEVITKLHLRAADWYESNGSPALALEHLLNTTERDRCVQLVTELVLPTYQAGQMSTVQRWLSALGDAAIEEYPPLAVLAGWIAALTGQTAEAERWAAIIDAASFDLVPLDGTASFDSARAMLRAIMCRRRTRAGDGRRQRSRWPRSRRGARGATTALLLVRARRTCSPATSTGPRSCSPRRSPSAATYSATPTRVVAQRVRARLAGDGSRAVGAKRPNIWSWRSRSIEEHRMHDYASACSPSPAPPASRCTAAT